MNQTKTSSSVVQGIESSDKNDGLARQANSKRQKQYNQRPNRRERRFHIQEAISKELNPFLTEERKEMATRFGDNNLSTYKRILRGDNQEDLSALTSYIKKSNHFLQAVASKLNDDMRRKQDEKTAEALIRKIDLEKLAESLHTNKKSVLLSALSKSVDLLIEHGLTKREAEVAIGLDDFLDFLGGLVDTILPVAKPVTSVVKNLVRSTGLFKSTGYSPLDYPVTIVDNHQGWSMVPGVNDLGKLENNALAMNQQVHKTSNSQIPKIITQEANLLMSPSGVNVPTISAYLASDFYGGNGAPDSRKFTTRYAGKYTTTISVTAPTSNFMVMIDLRRIFQSTTSVSGPYYAGMLTFSGYNSAIGSYGSMSALPGLASSISSNLSDFSLIHATTTFVCTLSDNIRSGQVTAVALSDQQYTVGATNLTPSITAQYMVSCGAQVSSANNVVTLRADPNYEGSFDPLMYGTGPTDSAVFLLFEGYPTGTIGFLKCTFDFVGRPSQAGAQLLSLSPAPLGPFTRELMAALISNYPWLRYLDMQSALELVMSLKEAPAIASEILEAVGRYASKKAGIYQQYTGTYRPLDQVLDGGGPMLEPDVISFEASE